MNDTLRWQLATCSYRAFHPGMGVPVRTSVGAYRAKLAGDVPQEYVKVLTPFGLIGNAKYKNATDQEWEEGYRDRLAKNTRELVSELDRLTVAHPGRTLVFLCFEDVHAKTRNVCHRSMAARWLTEMYGLSIPELSPGPGVATSVKEEGTKLW